MLAFPASPTVGQQFQTWTWDGVKWAPTPTATIPDCGYFSLNAGSPNAYVKFVPFNGNLIKINKLIYQIPAAGITASFSSCFLNGVASQTLVNLTTYRVYAFIHPTLGMQLDFSITGHVTSTTAGNVGVEIKSGDDTRTLVGIVYPFNSVFYDQTENRLTRSWFNRRPAPIHNGGGVSFATTIVILYCSAVAFQNEGCTVTGLWYGTADTWANLLLNLQINGAQTGMSGASTTIHTTGAYENVTALTSIPLGEGLCQFALAGGMTSGTASGPAAISGMVG
jgi:hypothetical protein